MTTYQRENSNQEVLTVTNSTELRNFGPLTQNIKCKWENQAKKSELKLVQSKNETVCRNERL